MANRYTAGSVDLLTVNRSTIPGSAPIYWPRSNSNPTKSSSLLNPPTRRISYRLVTYSPRLDCKIISLNRFNSSTFVKFLAESFSSLESEAESDSYYPPRLSENSVFIYQSYQLGSNQRLLRSGDYLLAGFLVGIANYPLYCMAYFGATYLMVTNVHFWWIPSRCSMPFNVTWWSGLTYCLISKQSTSKK